TLHLSGNGIKDSRIKEFDKVLSNCPRLQMLHLSKNLLTDKGMLHILNLVNGSQYPMLQLIDLTYNLFLPSGENMSIDDSVDQQTYEMLYHANCFPIKIRR